LGCNSSSKDGSGPRRRWGKGKEEGKGPGGSERRDGEKREIDITSHLTFL